MFSAMSFFGKNSYSLKGYWVLGDRSASNFVQLLTLHFLKESVRKERKALFALKWVHVYNILFAPTQKSIHSQNCNDACYPHKIQKKIANTCATLNEMTTCHVVISFKQNQAKLEC